MIWKYVFLILYINNLNKNFFMLFEMLGKKSFKYSIIFGIIYGCLNF